MGIIQPARQKPDDHPDHRDRSAVPAEIGGPSGSPGSFSQRRRNRMTTGKATTASRTPHKSLSMLFTMTRQPMPAETAWRSGWTGSLSRHGRNRMAIRITRIVQPSRQKSDDHQEDHHRQPDAAQIPVHALCHETRRPMPAETAWRSGWARISVRCGTSHRASKTAGIFCHGQQKEKTDLVDGDHSASAAEIG